VFAFVMTSQTSDREQRENGVIVDPLADAVQVQVESVRGGTVDVLSSGDWVC
jgi:hypothetical protein